MTSVKAFLEAKRYERAYAVFTPANDTRWHIVSAGSVDSKKQMSLRIPHDARAPYTVTDEKGLMLVVLGPTEVFMGLNNPEHLAQLKPMGVRHFIDHGAWRAPSRV